MELNYIKSNRISRHLKEILSITNDKCVRVEHITYSMWNRFTFYNAANTHTVEIIINKYNYIDVIVDHVFNDHDYNYLQSYFNEYLGKNVNLLQLKKIYIPYCLHFSGVSIKEYLDNVGRYKKEKNA